LKILFGFETKILKPPKISWFVGYSLFHRQQIDFVTNYEVGPKETILGFQTKNDKIQPKEIISGLSLHF